MNISGALLDSSGKPLNVSGVDFRLEILDPAGSCVLYRETHLSQDLSNSQGRFSLQIGGGSNVQNLIDEGTNPSLLTPKVFDNPGAVLPFTGCVAGVNLNPGTQRIMKVYYRVGGGAYVAMSGDVPMTSTAWSMVAETLGGKKASDFIQVKDDGATTSLSQTNADYAFSFTNWPKLKDLIDGNSNQYMDSTPTASVGFNNQRITNLADPSAASDAATRGYTDSNIAGRQTNIVGIGAGVGDGKVLMWDAAADRWIASNTSTIDSTKLPLAGGTMSGAISMNGYDLNAVGNLNMAADKMLRVSNNAVDPAANQAGQMWYNSTGNVLKYFNGTNSVQIANLDTGGKLQASWIPDNSITNARLADDSITANKINTTGVAINRLLITDGTDPQIIKYATCLNNEILKYDTTTGWGCATVSSLAPVKTVAGVSPDVAGNVPLNINDIGGAGTAALRDVGTAPGELAELDGTGKIPASLLPVIDGSQLTNVNAVKLQGYDVASTAPAGSQVLKWNASNTRWEPDVDLGITALTTDVVASGTGSVVATIQPNAITSAKINNTGIGNGALLITDTTTGATVTYKSCASGKILKWT
ncbi:MAG TPA: hypothetical protein PKC28_06270, partial [Bdellovibrionales bacterium]|nr:hypothetical protein [Bdellovibrionales bacterium]